MSRPSKWLIGLELLIVAALFARPFFTFSSGILSLPFVLLALWLRHSSVRDLGLRRPTSWRIAIAWGLAAVAVILTVQALLVQPLLQWLFDRPPDYSRFHQMTGVRLLGWIAAGWAMGAFAEEIIRAYLIYRIVELVGPTRAGWMAAILGSSVFYALNHLYQGMAGAVGVVVSCIGLGLLYVARRRNLWSNIVCHGMNDTIAFVAIFLGKLS
jgi:uncharacterized protein